MDSLLAEIAGLSPKQRALLEVRLQRKRSEGAAERVEPRPLDLTEVPLSFAQERMWLLDRIRPGNPAYHVHYACRAEGRLDVVALRRSLGEVVRRHEVLRTTYAELGSGPVQRIAAPSPVPIPVVDLSACAGCGAKVERLLAGEGTRPFDLAHGPLLRMLLLRLGDEEHVLSLTLHHIVSDQWSMAIFQRELLTLYAAFSKGEPSPLPELTVQYADFALWQRRSLQGERFARVLAYWADRLAGAPPFLDLPGDRPRPAVPSARGGTRPLWLPPALTRSLGELGLDHGATLYMILLTAFRALLARFSGQDDLSVGMPMAQRSSVELEPLIGFFVNTLVIRTHCTGDLGFLQALAHVREAVLDAHAHQDLPFEKLVAELQLERSVAHSPLFQVMFVLQNAPREAAAAAGLRLTRRAVPERTTKFDLSLALEESGSGWLGGVLEHSSDLFDGTTIARWCGHFERLLEGVAADPERPLRELSIWNDGERQQVLLEWNDSRREGLAGLAVSRRIERQAIWCPDAVAVVSAQGALSYGELNRQANRLALSLRALGVGPERIVGVSLERSPELVVALLGVLKAGGAYLPLDPDLPWERLVSMVAESGARVVLTAVGQGERLSGIAHVVELGSDGASFAAERGEDLDVEPAPGSLAYVIYTSGSTGRPKGAMNTHGALCNRLLWMQAEYRLTPEDRVLQKTPFSFDVSVWEFFWPLLTGARLVLADPGGQRDAVYLAKLVAREGVTTLHFVPSMLHGFLDELAPGQGSSLRFLLTSGEALSGELRDRFFQVLGCELHNLYGPTEAAIDVTREPCAPAGDGLAPPIGRPISNLRIHILGPGGRPVPIGVPGELFIGGVGLARGYVSRPDLTAERFFPDACGEEPGARSYRSGDRARYLPDGRIEFLGRLDGQLKIRGFRIEPGEIELALRSRPEVREAVVVGEDRKGMKRLVAYLVAGQPVPKVSALVSLLRGRLPEYMVPSAFVFLDEIPRTQSGKIDRRALPAPDGPRPQPGEAAAGPRSLAQELLLEIWSEVLDLPEIGIHDDFFALGGHSLTATKVLSRVREALHVDLPLGSLLEAPTVERFGEVVESARRPIDAGEMPPLVPVPRGVEIPLSFAQERFWLLDNLEPGNAAYNLGQAFRLQGALSLGALAGALSEIVRRHEILRTTFAVLDGGPVQIVGPPLPLALPVLDLSQLPAETAEGLARQLLGEEARLPFDLSRGPLLRALALRRSPHEHILGLVAHHIVADGWSLELLRDELAAFYDSLVAGQAPSRPDPPVQYADFAAWQRAWLRGQTLDRQMLYWRRQLAGAPPLLELPTDRPRPPVQSYRGATESYSLAPALAESLRRLARQRRVTPFIFLLASFATLVHRSSGQEDLSIGVPTAGRTRRELEGLVGLLVNTLVLRVGLADDPSFDILLARVRETALEAYAHQDLPFEKLVEELRPERSLSHSPLFQMMFIFRNLPRTEVHLSGLKLGPCRVDDRMSKFDLTLVFSETAAGLAGALEYGIALFDRTTILRLWTRFATLLQEIVAEPGRPLSALRLLAEPERQAVLAEHNDTWTASPCRCMHRLFERRAAEGPQRVALDAGGELFSYGELNRLANRLARRLRRYGVGPEVRVGFCADRSAAMVIGLLGVLKAGGCYVPLDPTYPRARLAFTLEDAEPSLVLAEDRFRDLLPTRAPVLSLPALLAADLEGEAAEDLEDAPFPENLAYVIYTSGSTGRPKGVQVTHGSLVSFLASMAVQPGLAREEGLLAVTSLAFDIAGLELYLPLVTGARLVLADRATTADGALLASRLHDSGAAVMQATPATWRLLLDAGWKGGDGLRVLCGGEALPRSLADRLLERAAEVWNLYGPTETTIWSSVLRVKAGAEAVISIGRPIDSTDLLLLDRRLQPVGLGVPGEVCIGGAGLARGYLHAPALTAERFIPHPCSGSGGRRLYRTGDLARRLPGGEIELLGRLDHQVKVRGFRIELGEVEAALTAHTDVEAAVVAVCSDRASDRLLIAYVVPAAGATLEVDALLAFVRDKLPGYMVPSALIRLPSLPLTPNGKVDRKALPAPEWGRDAASVPWAEPRTDLERSIAAVWAEVLSVPAVGLHDNFFALGGHSLMAARLVLKLQETCGAKILLRHLFAAPTVAGLATIVGQLRLAGDVALPPALPRIVPAPAERYRPFPLTEVQQAYWLGRSGSFALGNVASHSYSELDIPGTDLGRLEAALQRLIERHDMLRAVVLPDGNQQVLANVPPFRIEVQDLCGLDPDESEARLLELRRRMSHQVLPADRWPLFEVKASRLGPDLVRFHVSLDFLIADAWSTEILRRELGILYGDPDAALPSLDLSFRDCVLAELAWRDSEPYRRAFQYWSERLAALPPAPELPMAKGAASLTPRFTRREARLGRGRWRRLREQAGRIGVTPSGALLAAFSEVLRAWSKNPCFTLNLTLFNRLPIDPQIQSIVGDFTSLTLLAVDDSGPSRFEERARALQGQLFRDLDERLVSGVEVLRELNRSAGAGPRAIMPVVFTSTLDLVPRGEAVEEASGDDGEAAAGGFAYGITQTPQVWLDHQVGEVSGRLVFNWDALEEIFPAGMIDTMFSAYCRLLELLADEPASWGAERPLHLPPAELATRRAANQTAAPVSSSTLHGLFESQSARSPFRPAVIEGERSLTYGELERLANGLAHRLLAKGARRNRLVAILMEKGWQQVVAVLAVLKAGAAYLPVDPTLPRGRILQLLALGEVELALIRPGQEESLSLPAGIACLPVASGGGTESAPTVAHDPESLCYVIFTSGSTGVPKGVTIDHRGAVNTVLDVNRRFAVGPEDRVLALSSLSFDLSVYDTFGLLAAGGAVVLPDAESRRDPAHWAELVESRRVTLWNSVPALLEMLVEHSAGASAGRLGSLRLALLSGDWIPVSLPDRFRALAPDVQVVSLGGATEASIWSIFHLIGHVDPVWASIPYGKPLTNQRLHVLDPGLEPRPVWVPGDLYIGGIGLARGYWRDEEKTRASFVEHPWSGERLYRTGDLGRYMPDGAIEFLGREDSQVKIQGFRIELGEIEAALETLPEVRSGVVSAAGADRFHQRLVAYVVPREPPGALAAALPRLCRFDRRRTHRAFDAAALAGERLASLLFSLSQVRMESSPLPKYRYPSAGNLYPVQIYLHVHPGRVEGLAPGLYYYHPRHHRLILLAAGAHLDRTAYAEVNRSVFDSSAFALLLVTRMAAITPVYGELARDFSMLEAGYMGELLMETAAATGIGLCPIGDLGFDNVRPSLCLDGDHRLVHSFLGGPLPAVDAGPVPAVVPHTHQTSALPPPVAPSMERRLTELELLELKLSEPGLRRDVAGRAEVALPAPVEQGLELFAERRSHRELLAEPVGRGDLEELLGALAAEERTETGGQRYRYPSAGDLYMVRAYVHVKPGRVDGLEAGVYRYDPHHRSLQPVTPGAAMDRGVHAEVNQPVFDQAAFTLFLLAKTGAVVSRYGGLARDFCLLEAGYMGQLLMTVAPDNGLGLCPVGSVDFAAIAGSFQPAPDQIFVHCLLGGAVAQRGTHARVRADRDALPQILRQRLLEKLPEHMVPTAWMVLDALPLSANGKVDRRALPDPEQVKGPAQEVYVAPDSDLGRLIVKIWQEELQIERVGMYDNFFELGGNSLHMVRVHSRLTGELGREIRITELFKHSTVAALAQELGAAAAARPSFDSQREQAAKQRRAIERQRQRRQEKSTNEH